MLKTQLDDMKSSLSDLQIFYTDLLQAQTECSAITSDVCDTIKVVSSKFQHMMYTTEIFGQIAVKRDARVAAKAAAGTEMEQ
jgi:hypothetical protein